MINKRFILILIAFLSILKAKSQENTSFWDNTYLEANYGYGFVLPHHKSIEYFVNDHIRSFDIKLSQASLGKKYWNQLYRYPYVGLGYYRSNLGNDKVYGKANALYSFIKVPFIGNSGKTNLSYQISFGASYLTEHFDINSNYENLAIGSNLNIFIDFSLQSSIYVNPRLSITNSLRFSHFSNGKAKSPNKGLNLLSGSLGLIYKLNNTSIERVELPKEDIANKNEYTIIYSLGNKTISRYDEGRFYASSLVIDYNRNYSHKGRWSAGIDFFFDEANIEFSDKKTSQSIKNTDLYQIGLHGGHDLVFGNIAIVFNIGAYIYAPVETLAPIYSRLGLRYRIKNNIITNLTLKSHWAQASFIEWGVGYVF